MFSSIKMEEYMESGPSGSFLVKLVAKNIVLRSMETHFMHMRVNGNMSESSDENEDSETFQKETIKRKRMVVSTLVHQ